MTFTEAAVEVLRQAGKPLHYKKITELAIEQNLLSHVGKTPETTMSSRLSTMVKKDRGDAPITKVKPGVFALRDGAEATADEDVAEPEVDAPADVAEAAPADDAASPDSDATEAPSHQLPGADVFPEEDDDDDLILANLGDDTADKERSGRRRGGSGRGRRSKEDNGERSERSARGRRSDRDGDRGGRSTRSDRSDRNGRGRDRDRDRSRGSRRKPQTQLQGDWSRRTGADEPAGEELAYAIARVMKGGRKQAVTLRRVAENLVKEGRLSGDPESLVPTLAAAVRGDDARRGSEGLRPRFRLDGDELALSDWSQPSDAVRAENDVLRAAKRQREAVRKAFVKRLRDMPDAPLLELIATWLNARGVTAIRGVRATDNGFNLAGVWRRGPEEVPIAVVVYRKGIERDFVIDVRGALHHFGQARVAWLVGFGKVEQDAKAEAQAEGAAPVALFDGYAVAESMEQVGVGIQSVQVPLAVLDVNLLDTLAGPTTTASRDSADAQDAQDARDDKSDKDDRDDKSEDGDESSNGRRRRGRRRGGRRRSGERDDKIAADGSNDESASNDDKGGDDASAPSNNDEARGAKGDNGDTDASDGAPDFSSDEVTMVAKDVAAD